MREYVDMPPEPAVEMDDVKEIKDSKDATVPFRRPPLGASPEGMDVAMSVRTASSSRGIVESSRPVPPLRGEGSGRRVLPVGLLVKVIDVMTDPRYVLI